MNRKIRQAIDLTFTGIGIAVIFGAVMISESASLQIKLLWVVLGVLLIEAGVWSIAGKFIPSERRFGRLREEGDRMIALIRQLNGAALARDQGLEDETRFQATLEEMHAAVRLMAELASLEDGRELDAVLKEKTGEMSGSDQEGLPVARVA